MLKLRRQWRPGWRPLVLIAVLSVVAAACSGTETTETTADQSPATSADDVTETTSASDGQAGDPLTVWKFGSPEVERNYFATATEEFVSSSGIEVDVEFTDWPTRGQIVAQANASDDLPDVMVLENSMLPDLVSEGIIIPLADLDAPVDQWSESYVPELWALGHYEGEPYGFSPYVDLHTVLIYNHELLAEEGIDPPADWDELLAAAEALTTEDRFGVAVAQGGSLLDVDVVEGFAYRNGGRYFDGEPSPDNLIVDQEAWTEALDFVVELTQYAPPGITEMSYRDALQLFFQEQAAMVVTKSFAPIVQDDQGVPPDFPRTITKLPAPQDPSGPDESADFVAQAPFLFVVTRQADDLDSAREFLDFWAQPERHEAWWDGTILGRIPASVAGLESEGFAQTYPDFAEEWNDGTLFNVIEPIPAFPGRLDSSTILGEQLQALFLGQTTVADVLGELDAAVREDL